MFRIFCFFALFLKISTMPAPGSTAVISLTSGARGIASVPGPEPMSSTLEFRLISSKAIVVFTRSSYSLREFASYRSALSFLFQSWEGSSEIFENSCNSCRCFQILFQSGAMSTGELIADCMHPASDKGLTLQKRKGKEGDLFMPQCLNGAEVRCFPCWINATRKTDDDSKTDPLANGYRAGPDKQVLRGVQQKGTYSIPCEHT